MSAAFWKLAGAALLMAAGAMLGRGLLDPARRRAALLRSLGPFEEICHTRAGSTISSHCGPRCFGILYYNK